MRNTTYRYNCETCQYERVKISARSVVWYCLGLMVMASAMLAGILLLHDFLIHTKNETRLRRENKALRTHHDALSAQLDELRPVLASLENKDRLLHTKFFGAAPVMAVAQVDRASKEKLLLADAVSFREHVATLKSASEDLIDESATSNYYYGEKIGLEPSALPILNTFPTLQPIQPWQADRLISGFGMRVNPFHKGLYKHLGVDIAMTRGTPLIATASGIVSQLKRSELQAGYGNYVEIDHGNGIVTRYAHMEDIAVRYGARVAKGDVIGTVGSSGGSVAPHVHYEVIRDGKNVDPIHYMVEGLSSLDHHRLTVISHQQNQSLD